MSTSAFAAPEFRRGERRERSAGRGGASVASGASSGDDRPGAPLPPGAPTSDRYGDQTSGIGAADAGRRTPLARLVSGFQVGSPGNRQAAFCPNSSFGVGADNVRFGEAVPLV